MATSGPYDVIVVGAGLTGALIASTLADEDLHVVVLEAADAAGGAIRRQPGLALLGTPSLYTDIVAELGEERARTLWDLTSDNLVRLQMLLEQHDVAADKRGSLRLATTPDQSGAFRDSVTALQSHGFSVALEDDNRYGGLVAMSSPDDLVFAPQDLVTKLLDHDNIILELNTEAYDTKRRTDDSIAVWAHQRYLWADRVIFANGIHAVRQGGPPAPHLHPTSVHTIIFDSDETETGGRPLILDDGHMCFLPHQSRTYLTFWTRKEQDSLRRLSSVAEQLNPGALVRERFTTWIATTDDLLPVVCESGDEPGVFYANGLGPLGLNLALAAVDELAALVLEGEEPAHFGINRLPLT